jgi:hypothetical protein
MKVSFSRGATVSVGKFEFRKVDIGIEVECDTIDYDRVYAQIKGDIENKITEVVKEIKAGKD